LLDEQTQELHFEAATSANRAELKKIPVPLEGSIAGWIVQNNQSLVVDDAHQDPRYYDHVARKTQFDARSILGAPLRVKDRTIGALEVLNKRQNAPFTQQDVDTLETLATQAAVAIENARLYKHQQDQMQALKEAQARLVQSEKLAAVGELVAGVAHELNNPLTSVIGYAHMLQLNDLDEQSRADLEKIIAQARRASGIVRGLLDFARQRPPERKPVQINAILNSTIELLAYELRTHNIECSTSFSTDLPLTMADPYQLQQVFVNLVNNALQAMSEANGGGQLAITTQMGPSTFISQQNENELVIRITIQDDGPGIASRHLSSIFDPFFTTKPEGQGTGLGLSVCHGIVSEHGGHIWAESQVGRGATFFLELPLISPDMPDQVGKRNGTGPLRADFTSTTSVPGTQAHILVIDDEVALLDFLIRVLKREGYQVDAVSDGEMGLFHLAETRYDLVICDVRMPGLSGPEIYQQVQAQEPDLARRFLFITGDSMSPATQTFLEETGAPYLCKPFGPSDLTKQLRSLLKKKKA
jgi:two-component system NtrC family sensor kinase